jgi:hypothetical protein
MTKIIKLVSVILFTILFGCNNNQTKKEENKPQKDTTKLSGKTMSPHIHKAKEEIIYKTYCNSTYVFCVEYPSQLLIPQGESGSGDGQVFKSKNDENVLMVYRDFRDKISSKVQNKIKTFYKEDARENTPDKPKRAITYKKIAKDFFVVSGYTEGKIFYQKTILRKGLLVTCLLEYNESERSIYDKIAVKIFKSFK